MLQNSWYVLNSGYHLNKVIVIQCILLILLGVINNLLGLFVVPAILDAVTSAKQLTELLAVILFFSVSMIIVNGLYNYVDANMLLHRTALPSSYLQILVKKFNTTSYPHTEDPEFLGQIDKANRAVSESYNSISGTWNVFIGLSNNVICFIVYFFLLASVNPVFILLAVATACASYIVRKRADEWRYRYQREENESLQKLEYITEKTRDYHLAKDIRIFGLEDWLKEIRQAVTKVYLDFCTRKETIGFIADVLDALLIILRNGIIYGYLIAQMLQNQYSAAEFLLYFNAAGNFAGRVREIFTSLSMLHDCSINISIFREYIDTEEPFLFEEGIPIEPEEEKAYTLELKNVSFRYPDREQDTLHCVNLKISPGEKLAIVGLNGAGKTTLIKLLCGYQDPTQGSVLINGEDIRQYNRRDYYRHFAAVFQTFSALPETVAENVAQCENGDRERIRSCVEQAGLKEKIEALPKQYDTPLGKDVHLDGVELSGGEWQRLMLARALYRNSPIIVLDEPTAALDPIAENDIYMRYSELTNGKTSIYISHRLASTRFCDRIILLENGEIVEEGTHEGLLANGGRYAEIFRVQSKYYEETPVEGEDDFEEYE